MKEEELEKLTDQELFKAVKNKKPSPLIDAFFIGFLVGILLFSAATSSWGLVSLIPLYLIYIMLKKPKQYQAIQKELKKRKLR